MLARVYLIIARDKPGIHFRLLQSYRKALNNYLKITKLMDSLIIGSQCLI